MLAQWRRRNGVYSALVLSLSHSVGYRDRAVTVFSCYSSLVRRRAWWRCMVPSRSVHFSEIGRLPNWRWLEVGPVQSRAIYMFRLWSPYVLATHGTSNLLFSHFWSPVPGQTVW
ncbi:hypothetical protein BJY52DRAFT_659277 [Lactarius psammicola]|nr:hypothetical protein BJY52DRAFT_659277 [Lactarius psammicola]